MSDTPDTDEKAVPHIGFYSCATVPAEFARKLERERDEAREELYDIRLNLGEDAEGYTLIHAVCVLQQERDSLQIALEEISNLAKTLKRERDEARKEAHRFRALHYSHLGINASTSWFPWEGKLNE
jgi:hypothetical protein